MYSKYCQFNMQSTLKIVNEIFPFSSHSKSSFKIQSTFYIYSTCQFNLAAFQMLNSHMWLTATTRDTAVLGPNIFQLYLLSLFQSDFYSHLPS